VALDNIKLARGEVFVSRLLGICRPTLDHDSLTARSSSAAWSWTRGPAERHLREAG
jgi:hypothetical protein